MTPLAALLATDLRLQVRGGFWTVYAGLVVLYVAIFHALPDALAHPLLPALLFADPAVLGLFIVGALVLLERQDGVLAALGAAPTSIDAWLAAKVLSLGVLSVAVAAAVAAGAGALVRPDLLVLGIGGTAALCVPVGIAIASRTSTFNRFLAAVSVLTAPLALPFGEVLLEWSWSGLRWLPTGASLELIRGATGTPLSAREIARDVVVLGLSCGGAWLWARTWTGRYLFGRGGGVW